MANKSQHECFNCGNLFIEPTDQALAESGVQEMFRKQYCSKECETEDLEHLDANKLTPEELNSIVTEPSALETATRIIAGGFKIRP